MNQRNTYKKNESKKYLQKTMNEIINKKKLSTDIAFGFCGTAIVKQRRYM